MVSELFSPFLFFLKTVEASTTERTNEAKQKVLVNTAKTIKKHTLTLLLVLLLFVRFARLSMSESRQRNESLIPIRSDVFNIFRLRNCFLCCLLKGGFNFEASSWLGCTIQTLYLMTNYCAIYLTDSLLSFSF